MKLPEGLTAPQFKAVEALFEQGYGPTLASVPPKVGAALVAKAWAKPQVVTIGRDRLGPITVNAYLLTIRGHMLYCEWALKQSEKCSASESIP